MPNYKVVDADVLDADLSAIGNAIRSKTGTSELLTLDAMPTAIEGIETGGGGDTSMEDALVTRTITEYTNARVESVGAYAFYKDNALQSVSMRDCKLIGNYAFSESTKLQTANFPNAETINQYAFSKNTSLLEVSIPKAKQLGNYAFRECTKLTTVDAEAVTNMHNSVFNGCKALQYIRLPNLTNNNLGSSNFSDCTSLHTADLGYVQTNFFSGCTNLTTLILRSATLVNLASTNTFTKTPFAEGGTGGVVYCPSALIEQYQQATNWSTLYAAGTCTFLPIEGSEYE